MSWLITYDSLLAGLAARVAQVKALAVQSDAPEDMQDAGQRTLGAGLRWAQDTIARISSASGDLALPSLEQTLATWEKQARAGATEVGQDLDSEQKRGWTDFTERMISSLAATGAGLRTQWITLRDAYAKASPTWESCITLGSHPTQATLTVKAMESGTVRASDPAKALITVNVDPYYEWKRLEAAPLGFAVFTPGAESLSLVDGRVERKDESFRVRAGTVLLANLSAFGAREEQSLSLMVGVGLVDASSNTTGKADILFGLAYRLQDAFGLSLGFSLSERPRRRDQITIGQPLPAGITSIEGATEDTWRPGIALGVSLKGYKF